MLDGVAPKLNSDCLTQFLSKISQLVKPGGYIIMTTPLGNYFLNKLPKFSDFENPEVFERKQFGPDAEDHIFLLHFDEMIELARRSNLTILKRELYTNFISIGNAKFRKILPIIPESFVFNFDMLTRKLPAPIALKIHTGMAVLFQRKL